MTSMTALGIMTGTSCDGINCAVICTDGEYHIERLGFIEQSFPEDLALRLKKLGQESQRVGHVDLSDHSVQKLQRDYTQAVIACIQQHIALDEVNIIGFHGQTILHKPEEKRTIQLGDPDLLAQATQRDVIFNFRHNDMMHGGQGAPFAPLYHQACVRDLPKPTVFTNIGGVANVTYIDQNTIIGFDTGPGNSLSDDLCHYFFQKPFDYHGEIALSGKVNHECAETILQQDYLMKKPPKSCDRNIFNMSILMTLRPEDALATANYITASSIIAADRFYPSKPAMRVIAGGGVRNHTLMNYLRALSDVPVKTADAIGLNSSAIEAECFAWLAVRSLKGLYLSLPSITGVVKPVSGGICVRAK